MKARKNTAWKWVIPIVAAGLVLVGLGGWFRIRKQLPAGILQDIRAGIAAKDIRDPDQRLNNYLEGRYGSMQDPANRHKVFVDFFNIEHIKALQLMVKHSPEGRRQESIDAMTRWIENYRETLTPKERDELRQQFSSDQGRALLRQATVQYNNQSVEYRGQTAAVISQLLKTLYTVQSP